MTSRAALLPLFLLAACGSWDTQHVGTLEDTLDAEGLAELFVNTGTGELRVLGDPAAESVSVTLEVYCAGPSCTRRCDLDTLDFRLEDRGDGEAVLIVYPPENHLEVWIDVTVTLPSDLMVTVRDEIGEAEIRDVSGVDVVDGLGDLQIEDIAGDVVVEDGSGDIWIDGVDGDVRIDDGIGDILVVDVAGRVTIRDGSGDIVAQDVGELDVVENGIGTVTE